jgi:hypothetical protein
MFFRSTLKRMARLALAATLFAQMAVVFAACESAGRTPARAIALAESEPGGGNCHEQEINANLCLVHCLSTDQSADTPQVVVPAWIASTPITVATSDRRDGRALHLQYTLPRPSAPPPRILFQSFLI